MSAARIEFRGVCKAFPGAVAADHVDLRIERGTIHAIVGENGAGKTTLMRIAYGMVELDAGQVLVDGQPADWRSPRDAMAAGIGMVHQHFMQVGNFTVLENLVLGSEPRRGALIDWASARARLGELARDAGMAVDPEATVNDLDVGARQQVEILAALYRGADTVIFDEPTAVLAPHEASALFDVMRRMRDAGSTLVLITHKLDEVLAVADAVTVMRSGRVVARYDLRTQQVTQEQLALDIVGAALPPGDAGSGFTGGDDALNVRDLIVTDDGRVVVDGVSLTLHRGEVLGVAGVAGNGQTELAEAIMGLRPALGRVALCGTDVTGLSVRARREAGLAYIPEDRYTQALLLDAPLWENRILGHQTQSPASHHGILTPQAAKTDTQRVIDDLRIAAPGVTTAASALSGGNQQKLVVGRELSGAPAVLVACQPTRGVDIGAQALIWEQIAAACRAGLAVLLFSSDLDELLAHSDQLIVMQRGRVTARMAGHGVDARALGLAMAGQV